MGVRGLSTFFNNNPDLSKPFKLHDTIVIIDGNNLIHLLYFSNKVDCVFGGDYNRYATSIRKYFSSYIDCNIKPIVIFDGGYAISDRKFKTVLQRSKERLTQTQHIAKYGECAGNVLPINAPEVFRNVLSHMGISFAQCDYEADDQVTALANHYKCPVLSDDSDFYIFDLVKGFIRLSSVDSTVLVESDVDGNQYKYLKCQIYYIEKFLSYFPGIDRNVLPLFGTLVGNDFVQSKDFAIFFSNIQLPKNKYKGLKINQRQRKIIGVLSWLRNYDLEEGVKQVLCRFKKERREHIKTVIEHSVDGYKIESCNLVHILDNNVSYLTQKCISNTKLISPCGEILPIQFIVPFHQGYLPSFFLNIINLHRIFLPTQVENTSLESSFVCSRHIRQVLYGIILQHNTSNYEVHAKCCLNSVEEYDRRSGSIQRFVVDPIFTLTNGNSVPKLNQLYDMNKEVLIDLLLEAENCQKSFISPVPSLWQLLIVSINYWLKNSSPGTTEEFVYALILCVIYFSVLQKRTVNENSEIVTKVHKCVDCENVCSLINSISTSDALFAAKNLKKYLHKPSLNRGNPLILHIIHSYSQFQTCILYSSYLNMLLGFPLEFPKLHETLSGTMIYNLTKDILSRPFPDLFVSELLGRQTSIVVLFNTLKTVIFKNVPPGCYERIDRSEFQSKKSSDAKKKSHIVESGGEPEVDCNKFQYLCSLDEESDVDNFSEVYI